MVTVEILIIWILKIQKLKAMEARLLKTKQTQKAHKNTNNPPDKTPAFMDLKPFFFKPNLGFF